MTDHPRQDADQSRRLERLSNATCASACSQIKTPDVDRLSERHVNIHTYSCRFYSTQVLTKSRIAATRECLLSSNANTLKATHSAFAFTLSCPCCCHVSIKALKPITQHATAVQALREYLITIWEHRLLICPNLAIKTCLLLYWCWEFY